MLRMTFRLRNDCVRQDNLMSDEPGKVRLSFLFFSFSLFFFFVFSSILYINSYSTIFLHLPQLHLGVFHQRARIPLSTLQILQN